MKKIYGIFRGFPGLGRVSSGIALLIEFQNIGYKVSAISYLQGNKALYKQGIPLFFNYCINKSDITSIGINPITEFATRIIDKILNDKPDIVIIDGEPLLQSTLSDVYPKDKIISLLNPLDLHNDVLPISTISFYYKNYLTASNVIVHGADIEKNFSIKRGAKVHYIPTILRQEIIYLQKNNISSNKIVGILGGGTFNASNMFLSSTIEMGKKIISIAKIMQQYLFVVYCNDKNIKKKIEKNTKLPSNICIIDSYTSPLQMYKETKLVIARAGRNVISELLYLNIPGLLIATKGDYRSVEQEKNIDTVIFKSKGLFEKLDILDNENILIHKINKMINMPPKKSGFTAGNSNAIEIIKNVINGI